MKQGSTSSVDLATFRKLPKEERRAALRSLVSNAGPSSVLTSQVREAIGAGSSGSARLTSDWQDRVLQRLQAQENAYLAEKIDADELLEKLREHPVARRVTVVRNTRRFHTWSLCRLLQRESRNQLFRNPQEGLAYALLAVDIAEGGMLPASSEALLSDLKASSWAFRGNAHRALSQLGEAEEAFRMARVHLGTGSGDPLEDARLSDFEGLLRLAQRRFRECESLLNRAIHIFLKVGDRHQAGVSTLNKAALMFRTSQAQRSLELNQRALEMIDPARDLRMHNAARHNLFCNLVDLGHFQQAAQQVPSIRAMHEALGDRVTIDRVRWAEAEIAVGLGQAEEAIRIYTDVRRAFVDHGMVLDVALVTLDLASCHLKLNQTSETKRLAAESLPLFQSLGIQREAIAAWLVFQQAAEREMVTLELVKEVANYLRASRANPELKFRG